MIRSANGGERPWDVRTMPPRYTDGAWLEQGLKRVDPQPHGMRCHVVAQIGHH